MYQQRLTSREQTVAIRGIAYHLRLWGDTPTRLPPLLLLHGWMDVGASWQFVVDAFGKPFTQGRLIIAPDWRGFGRSRPETAPDCYHFPDYLGDLDQLIDHCAGTEPVDIVGHSMGGNIAMMYAGARPARIRRLVNLEGFGLPATRPTQAPNRYAQWMDELQKCRRGEMALKDYDSIEGVAQRLMKTNPCLGADKAQWLAQHWAAPGADGRWRILGEAAHKVTSAQLYRVDEALALYAAITAPVLDIEAESDSLGQWWGERFTREEYRERLRQVRDRRSTMVAEAGHMLHHDQPETVARLIENFLNKKTL